MPELKGKGYRVSYLKLGGQVAATIQVRRDVGDLTVWGRPGKHTTVHESPELTLAEALKEIADDLMDGKKEEAVNGAKCIAT